MVRIARWTLAAASIICTLGGCQDAASPLRPTARMSAGTAASVAVSENGKHVVVFTGADAPADFAARVSARGGTVETVLDGVGVAVVSGLTHAAAGDLASTQDINAVEPDITIGSDSPEEPAGADAAEAEAADASSVALTESHASPAGARYYARQWNLRAIKANAAWDAGYLGSSDVTVFILDTGIDYLQPDLVGRVDLSRSVSLVPSEDALVASKFPGRHPITDLHSHGTAVAALIASNADSLAGVTQQTTLVGVKVHDRTRTGPVDNYIRGIKYAADHGADVIHLSIPFIDFKKDSLPGLIAAINRALNYAHRKGAVLVAAAGNMSSDLDHDQDRWRFCNGVHVICVSATAPTAAAGVNGPWENVDAVAPTTNFGRSAISVAGPGGAGPGGGAAPNTAVWVTCSTAGLVTTGNPRPCSQGALRWQSSGNTFGAAVTSGLAALLISTMVKGQPDQIRAAIEKSADDLGEPGTDPYYGKGRINVARAVGALDQLRP